MTTKEAQILLLEYILKAANKGIELKLSAADIGNLECLISLLNEDIKKQYEMSKNIKDHIDKVYAEPVWEDVKLENLDQMEVDPLKIEINPKKPWFKSFIKSHLYIECGYCGCGFLIKELSTRVACSCGTINKIPSKYIDKL